MEIAIIEALYVLMSHVNAIYNLRVTYLILHANNFNSRSVLYIKM